MGDQPDLAYHSLPLVGATICCTSITPDVRQTLTQKCEEMGARSNLDLTSEVTHLICAAVGSAKYQYVARMRLDVKVLQQKWVDVMYEQWLNGEDIDPHEFERVYRYRTFSGLAISVTGIPDVAERERIEAACIAEGATYHPDLTRGVSHLLAAAPTGKKYDFARMNNIKIVSPEWFTDSLERGMALDEACYDPNLEPEKIGVGAKPEAVVAKPPVSDTRGKRKIRKTAEEKLGSQSQHIWDDIMGHGGASRPSVRDEWEETPINDHRKSSALTAVPIVPKPGQRQASIKQALFCETSFFVWGFSTSRIVKVHSILQSMGAEIVDSREALARTDNSTKFVLIPRQTLRRDYPSIPKNAVVVTEWWLEKCLHFNRIFQPAPDDITIMPLEEFPIAGFKGMDICITLFVETDLLHWSKLIPMLGATLHDSLTKSRTLLLTRVVPCSGEKFEYAIAQNIPVLRSDWLIECIRQRCKVPIDQFRVYRHTGSAEFDVDGKRKADSNELSDQDTKKPRRADVGQAPDNDSPGKQPQRSSERSSRSMGISKNCQRLALEECIICVSRQLRSRKCELEKVAQLLGASVLESLEEDCTLTHLIHASTSPSVRDSTKDFRLARGIEGCAIVSPDWLYQCLEVNRRVDEKAYPPIYAPTCGLEMGVSNSSTSMLSDSLDGSASHLTRNQHETSSKFKSSSSTAKSRRSSDTETTGSVLPSPGPQRSCSDSALASMPLASIPVPLSECTDNLAGPSLQKNSSVSSLSSISEILGKIGKEDAPSTMEKPCKKPRAKLRGKVAPGTNRPFSRTPSWQSSTASQQEADHLGSGSQLQQPPFSQVVKYVDEEDENERKLVRRKLNPDAVPVPTQRTVSDNIGRAVDVVNGNRRSTRRNGF